MSVSEHTLRVHVRHSNLIEGIIAAPGEPLFDGHLEAARIAAQRVVHPNILHEILMKHVTGMGHEAGRIRTGHVFVGPEKPDPGQPDRTMPKPEVLGELMSHWMYLVEEVFPETEDPEAFAFLLHVWLLSIHPYVDGNGRTARLVYNMLRTSRGLPWKILRAWDHPETLVELRAFEGSEFKVFYKDNDIYPCEPVQR